MNNWNFNELTQQDQFDFKACQREDKSIYGIPDKSECSKGKEITSKDIDKLSKAARSGDKKAQATLKQIQQEQQKASAAEKKAVADKKAAADKKKKEAEGGKGKKGKGKKGGGKGKGGKGKKGGKDKGGKGGSAEKPTSRVASTSRQEGRKEQQKAMRKRLGDLQKSLRSVKNPEVRKALESQISDLLKGVNELSKGEPSSETQTPSVSSPTTGTEKKPTTEADPKE